jgi:UDP-N-acetyl-2-amino-2-deoxyglucuronate dehydrogenase
MVKKYNVGIVGYGWVATAHIAAINNSPNAQVTAVYSSRKLDEKELSAQWGCPIRTYTDLQSMLKNDEIDIISICGYPHQHKEHAVAAARAGKHLIIEKPIALSWDDCKAVEAAVREAEVKTCVCFELRYSNQLASSRSLITQGLLGNLHYGEVDYYHGIGPWYGQFRWNIRKDAGGSSLLTAGCHALDALLFYMGTEVSEVTSYDARSRSPIFQPYEYTTSSVTILKFRNGSIGKCAAIVDCLQPYYFHTHLCGSEGSLLDNKFHSMKLGTNKNAWSTIAVKLLDSGDVSDHPYEMQFNKFFECTRAGIDMPYTNLGDAMITHQIMFAADRSAATGNPVKL